MTIPFAQQSPRALRIYPVCSLKATDKTPFVLFSYFKSLLPGGLQKLNHLQGGSQLQHSCDPYFRISAIIIALTVQLWGWKERLSEGCRCQCQRVRALPPGDTEGNTGGSTEPHHRASPLPIPKGFRAAGAAPPYLYDAGMPQALQ